jgi:hypothetical protein
MWMWVLWSLQKLPESIRELAQSQGGKAVSDTPRTDELTFDVITIRGDAHLGRENYNDGWGEFVESKFARTLEREINASNTIIKQQQLLEEENLRLQERIKRLDETLEGVTDKLDGAWGIYMKFKEAKP